MRGLLQQLSALDSDAEAAVGWIASFDQLIARHADLNEIVRSAAGLAGCIAGMSDGVHAIHICVGPDGRDIEGESLSAKSTTLAKVGDGESVEIWLQRVGGPLPHDELVVERMTFAIAVTLDRIFTPREQLNGANALEELIDGTLEEAERKWAAQLLCLENVEWIRVLAIAHDDTTHSEISVPVRNFVRALQACGEIARVTRIGTITALITTADEPETLLSDDLRAGIGSHVDVLSAPRSWSESRALLRLTNAMPAMQVSNFRKYEDDGGLIALTMTPSEYLRQLPESLALDELALSSSGRDSIQALDAYLRKGSMRAAATELYLHHTSVAARLDHASDALGFSVSDPQGTFRAKLALTNWQLSRTPS